MSLIITDTRPQAALVLADGELPEDAAPQANIVLSECDNLAQRLHTACMAAVRRPAQVRIELTGLTRYNGTFMLSDAQTLAVRLLDALCESLAM